MFRIYITKPLPHGYINQTWFMCKTRVLEIRCVGQTWLLKTIYLARCSWALPAYLGSPASWKYEQKSAHFLFFHWQLMSFYARRKCFFLAIIYWMMSLSASWCHLWSSSGSINANFRLLYEMSLMPQYRILENSHQIKLPLPQGSSYFISILFSID